MAPLLSNIRTYATAALAIGSLVRAQNSTQTWSPAPACTNGLPNPSGQNGTFTDTYGAIYQVNCGQRSNGASYGNDNAGPDGISACFPGCDKRNGCIGFYYVGTVAGKTVL